MFEKFFEGASRIQELRDSPGGFLLDGFAKELSQLGYAEITARRHIRAAEHLIHWSGIEGLPMSSMTEKIVERF